MPLLDLESENRFVSGACRYIDYPPNDPTDRRLVIPVRFVGLDETIPTIVDTGSPWCVLNPSLGEKLGDAISFYQPASLWMRGIRLKGGLWSAQIELRAILGVHCTVDATVFIPTQKIDWTLPNFLGLDGFLDRIRFAVDPEETLFYFGALGDA